MCGLVGAFAFADTPADVLEAPVRALTAKMVRRGPDDEGLWNDGVRCAMGFRRLAILDLTPAGHQPMHSADGRYTLVVNGEIYNFRELRATLQELGYRFRSTGDAETLLYALVAWGVGALPRLNGMFALAFYDARERSLLLARDHAAMKPLYWAHTRQGAVFASQYNQVIAHSWCDGAKVDPDGLALYLRLGSIPPPFSLHGLVRQVEAGEWLGISGEGTVRRGRFFELPVWQAPTLRGAEAVEAFDEAFAAAVRRHLVSDVPVGVLLSGGIDSPLVAAEAHRASGSGLDAFTIAVDGANEAVEARRYAEELGLRQTVETMSADDAVHFVDEVAAASTEPCADESMFPALMVSRLARRHVKVVLSGDGGDELYWGYPGHYVRVIAQAQYFAWPRPARFVAAAARRYLGVGAATRDVLAARSLGDLYLRTQALLSETDLRAIFPSLPTLPQEFGGFRCQETNPERAAQWVRWSDTHVYLARVLGKVDRASMHHSLEVRVPLLDREVIDVAWRTDWRTCLDLRTRIGKAVLRAALARRTRFQTTRKRGFSAPLATWLSGPLRPLLLDFLRGRRDLLGLPFKVGAVEALDRRLQAGDHSVARGLWMMLSLARWHDTHGRPLTSGELTPSEQL